MLEHLNNLNVIPYGKGLLVYELCTLLQAFNTKLILFSEQAKENKFTHLHTLQRIQVSSSAAYKYSNIPSTLRDEFCR